MMVVEGTQTKRPLWFTAVLFVVAGCLAWLPYRVPVHRALVCTVALSYALLRTLIEIRLTSPTGRAAMLVVGFLASSVMVASSGGPRSPFLPLFFIVIVEASILFSTPWGLVSAVGVSLSLLLSTMFNPDAVGRHLDRIVASFPFFLAMGLLAQSLERARRLQEQERLADATHMRDLEVADRIRARELEIAREIQQAVLPKGPPIFSGFDIDYRIAPQQAVGGDLIGFKERPCELQCIVADVTGKGFSAAMVVGALNQLLTQYESHDLSEAVGLVNEALVRDTPSTIAVTLIWARIHEDGRLLWCNAGHPPPFLYRAGRNNVEVLYGHNPVLGWFDGVSYQLQSETLLPGDMLLLYSDGLTDARLPNGSRLEEEAVRAAFHAAIAACWSPQEIAGHLLGMAVTQNQADDVTLVLLKRT